MKYGVLLCLTAVRLAADVNSTVYLPHVVDGGTWQTVFTIVNLSPRAPAQATIHLWAEDGNPLALPFAGMGAARNQVDINLPPSGMTTVETTGDPASSTTQGWADFEVKTSGLMAVSALMRRHVPGLPDWEVFVPSRQIATASQIYVFDNTSSKATGFAIMNASRVNAGVVLVTIRDENGQTTQTATLNMPAGAHRAFSLADQFSATAERRGTIELIPQPGGWLGFIGLRFNSTGAITNLDPMTP